MINRDKVIYQVAWTLEDAIEMFKRIYKREPTDEEITIIDSIDFSCLEDYLESQWIDIDYKIRETFGNND